jgi:hypothetical protein
MCNSGEGHVSLFFGGLGWLLTIGAKRPSYGQIKLYGGHIFYAV